MLVARRLSYSALQLALATTFVGTLGAQSGTGTILGQVTGSAHRALASAAVWIDSTALISNTDDNGRFRLQRIAAGRHTLLARFIGYEIVKREVTVVADSTIFVDFAMSEVAHSLSAIVVEGQRDAQARALSRQQNADNVSNVVSADVIGRSVIAPARAGLLSGIVDVAETMLGDPLMTHGAHVLVSMVALPGQDEH